MTRIAGRAAAAREKVRQPAAPTTIGWLEHVSLPDLGLAGEVAKIDTGARTSSLHVDLIRPYFDSDGQQRAQVIKYVRHPGQKRQKLVWDLELREFRKVRSSNGAVEERAVIVTRLQIGSITRKREFTLTNRKQMRYQILVGRKGLGKLFLVNPSRRFLLESPVATRSHSALESAP